MNVTLGVRSIPIVKSPATDACNRFSVSIVMSDIIYPSNQVYHSSLNFYFKLPLVFQLDLEFDRKYP